MFFFLRASDRSRFIESFVVVVVVVYFSFNAQEVEIEIKKDPHAFELYRSKNKDFL